MSSSDYSRDPDAWLSRAELEEQKTTRGRLKIFFGASAGVGKTYDMLRAAHKQKSEGLDVVVGYVETHGRQETDALLGGLEIIPRKSIEYRGRSMEEFDLDAAIARRPQLLLVDELAHTNLPGSRHSKRWQDVEELLEAGIDVYTTLNVQHVESLHDLVAQITRISIKERVPDSILEKASEIELVDISAEDLLQRLGEGKVYVPDQAQEAIRNFFQKGNLIALRELALRFTAERVVDQMQQYRDLHAIKATWPAAERIVVCVSSSPLSERLVRSAKRMANALHSKWLAVYVEGPREVKMSSLDRNRAATTLHLAEQLGADTLKLTGDNPAAEIIKCARQFNASKIIIGKPARARWKEVLFGSVVDDVIRHSGEIDVHVITGDHVASAAPIKTKFKPTSPIRAYANAFLIVVLCTALASFMIGHFELANVVMAYLLGVVFIATHYGRGPSIMASIVSVAAFDFFFVPQRLTLAVSDSQYLITFAVMLTVALVISTLMTRIKHQAETSRLREIRTAALYSMSRELSSTLDLESLISIGLQHLCDVFDARCAICLADQHGQLGEIHAFGDRGINPQFDRGIATWVFRNRQKAGLGTDTLPAAGNEMYIPLLGANRAIGVLVFSPREHSRLMAPDQAHLLDTFTNQIALACERAKLSEENELARLQVKGEQLRNSLLSSVSHDLRTPLATITGAASSIIEGTEHMGMSGCKEMAREIYSESARLNKLVGNLLDMTRLQSGAVVVNKQPYPVEEIVGTALAWVDDRLGGRTVTTNVPADLPMVLVDACLIQQVLVNLLENAIKYTPESSSIAISASASGNDVELTVADNGPGIPIQNRELVFEKFFRDKPAGSAGVGLGLAICRSIIEAHGGKIWVEDAIGGGAVFKFLLAGALLPDIGLERE